MSRARTHRWKAKRDPLWRGDSAAGITEPTPTADPSLVRHILYLEGMGRATPYHSTSEAHETAARFAGSQGKVYRTTVGTAEEAGVSHISRLELLGLLRGKGKGRAKWNSAYEIMLARR